MMVLRSFECESNDGSERKKRRNLGRGWHRRADDRKPSRFDFRRCRGDDFDVRDFGSENRKADPAKTTDTALAFVGHRGRSVPIRRGLHAGGASLRHRTTLLHPAGGGRVRSAASAFREAFPDSDSPGNGRHRPESQGGQKKETTHRCGDHAAPTLRRPRSFEMEGFHLMVTALERSSVRQAWPRPAGPAFRRDAHPPARPSRIPRALRGSFPRCCIDPHAAHR